MNDKDFHSIKDTQIDDSIIQRDFPKMYHQHGVRIDNQNQNIKIDFRENMIS